MIDRTKLTLVDGDIVSQHLSAGQPWEEHVYRALVQHLEGDVLDFGANVGAFTLRFAQHANRVIAFEPNDQMFAALVKNIASHGLMDKVVAINEGVYSYDTSIAATRTGMPPSSWTWQPKGGGGTVVAGPAKWPHMDRRVSAIKCDIQGADLHAILGITDIILRDRPYIVFEYEHDFAAEHSHLWADYRDTFQRWSYELTPLIGQEPGTNGDYLAEPR